MIALVDNGQDLDERATNRNGRFPIVVRCPYCKELHAIHGPLITQAEKEHWWDEVCKKRSKQLALFSKLTACG